MSKFLKSFLLLVTAGLFAATGWTDITGVTPWACYQFNGSEANTGSGGKAWNGGSFTYTVTGATGDAASNVAVASGSRWTATGDFSVADGFTLSLVATEGSSLSSADNNGHLISMAQKGQSGYPRWWIRNSATSGTVKLQGLFTETLDVTHTENLTGFHHYVVRISADRTVVDVFVDGEQIDTSALTVNPNLDDAYHGYQVNNRWGGGSTANAKFDDLRMYTKALTNEQIKALYYAHFKFKHVLTFDGDGAEIDTWNANKGEKPSNSNLVSTPFGKGFVVASGVHPWSGYSVTKPFSIVMYANIASVALVTGDPATKKDAYLVACGNNGNHIALVKTAPDTVQLWKNGTCVEGLTITDPMLNGVGTFHLFSFGTDDSGTFLQVDGQKVRGAAIAAPNGGFQIGSMYQGLSDTTTRVQGYGMIVDELYEYGAAFDNDALDALAAYFPATYPTLSMAADTNQDNVISKAELDAAVGAGVTKWNVSGEVVISLDADVDPALTALTLLPANASGDSLTITGVGSLYGDNFALMTAIPVDITNQKNNPSITLSGAGDVTIRKGKGGIAPAMNNYTGTFTVDDGQQITRMGGDLTIPFTVGANGAKLHSNGSDWTVSSKISGTGTLTIESPSHTISFTSDTTEFSGNVEIMSGTLYLDRGKGSVGSVFNNANTTLIVKSGAIFKTHLTQNGTSDYSSGLILEPGAQVINHDGHMNHNGDLVVNNGGDVNSTSTYQLVYNKVADFKGIVSGQGTLNLTVGNTQYSPHTVKISNANNTFSGTYHINPNNGTYEQLILEANGKMDDASVKMSKGQFKLMRDTSIMSLTGTAGTVTSNDSTVRTLTLNGNSDVRNLTFENVNLVIAAGETFVNATTVATANDGVTVKVVLTADEMLNGVEVPIAPSTDAEVTYVFLASDGSTLLNSGNSNRYEALQECEYDVAEGKWSDDRKPSSGGFVTINFGGTESEIVDLAEILNGVTALEQLVVLGSYGGTITSSALISCQSLDVQTDVELPIELVNSCSTLSVVDDKILTINVAQEVTLNKALSGNYAVKKSGSGTLTLGANVNVDDGVEILAGTLKFGNGVIPYKTGSYPTTNAGNVKVHTDATLDVNGNGDAFLNMVTLCDGATYANSSSTALGNNTRQLKGITLEGDATVHANANFGILAGGHAASTLDLGGHTLTKTGSGAFWLSNTAVRNGILKVEGGKFEKFNTPTFSNVTFDSDLDTAFDLGSGSVTAPVTKKGTGAMTINGVISGEGAVTVEAGNLTLASENTYAGGTDIAANATLTITNAGALGTSVITGAGTLKFSGLVPTNLSGLTTGTAASDETPASGWTGTFYMMNRASAGSFPVNDWGNANSTVCLESCSGYLAPSTGVTIVPNIRLEGYGWRSQNGDQDGGQFTFTGALSGSGKLEVAGNPEAGNFYKFTGNVSGFTGYVNVEGNHRIVFGDAESQGNGKITIATDVTIASGKTWTAVNGITITENGTLTISEARALPTNKTVSGAGALVINGTVDISGITGALTCALTAEDGATVTVTDAQLAAFAKVTIPETATLIVKANRSMSDHLTGCTYDITAGAGSTIDGDIVVEGMANASGKFAEGKLTIDVPKNPTLTGSAWWWDYEFNGSATSIGSDTGSMTLESTNQKSYTDAVDGNQELYFQQTPWRNATFTTVDAFTAVMYCQPGDVNNTALVGFGSVGKYANSVAILLATGDNAANGAMKILLVKGKAGGGFDEISLADKLTVPNATKAKHLYAFTFDAQADKTVISVYVDGKLKKTTTVHERFHVQDGFQIGSAHGGLKQADNLNGNISLTKYANSGDSGTIDFLRVTKGVLSADAMRALAEAYKYESENGEAARTIEGEETTTTWVADGTWTQSGEAAPVDQPNDGTNVILTANVATEVTVNLEEAVTYETVAVAGNAAVTFKKGGTATFKAGDITIGTDVTIEYGAVDVDTLIVNGGKTLTFDFKGYDFDSIYKSTTLPLTGLATLGENADVEVVLPTLPDYLTAECVFDANKSEYALAITVTGTLAAEISQDCTWDEVTWKIGVTEIDRPADLSAFASIPVVLTQDATLTLESAVTLNAVTVSGGTLTLAGAELTVASLTLDNADVMATTTLRASAVTGTEGTERLTMTLPAGEYTRAMTLLNCAFTKAGAGTLKLNPNGTVLNQVVTTLAEGKLELRIGNDDPQIEETTFIYMDANEDGVADGELTNYGWVKSSTVTTFVVPKNVTGKAVAGSCLSSTGEVVKQGAGTLVLGIMTTDNAGPYTGATTIEAGTLVYQVADARACTMTGAITVAAKAAIKGSAKCTLASLSFANGAVIDATDAPVVATDVTLPDEDGTVTVRMTNHGEVLKTTGLDNVKKFVVETPVANCSLMVTENGLAYVAAPATGDVEFSAEVQEMLNVVAQAAASEGVTSLTIEGITLAMDGEGNPVKADIAGLEVFESVTVLVVPDGENGTGVAMVNYVFGISDITVNGDGKIEVKASVDCLAMDNPVEPIEGEDAGEGEVEMPELPRPTFVNGVTVALYNGTTEIGTAVVNAAGSSEITITSTNDLVTIFKNGTGTLDLTVKVKSAQASETLEGGEEEVTPAE